MKTNRLLPLWLASAAALAASTITPARRPAAPVLLRGGTVHTVSGGVLPRTDVLLADGRIAALGAGLTAPAGAEIVDATGKHLYPGLILANSQLGLSEIGSVRATVDTAEIGPINPNAHTQVAVNPESELLPVARLNGVLSALAAPVAASEFGSPPALFAGTSALLRLDGWTWEDLTVRPAVALHVYWPATAAGGRRGRAVRPAEELRKENEARVRLITDTFAAARAYAGAKAAGRPHDTDLRLEALLPVLSGERRLFIHADDLRQIGAALDWAAEQNLAITLVGGRDAWRLADRLHAADVPVILGGTFNLPPRRDDAYDTAYAAPAKLQAAGVRFCLAIGSDTSSEAGNERNLPYEAALAVAHGLAPDLALRAITLSAAELLGVADELGSLDVGKRATLLVTDGDPLEITTQVERAYIDGAAIELRSRQTDLYEKYRRRYAP